jgi:hypothetical protein
MNRRGREILLLGSVRESIMKSSETSGGKNIFFTTSLRRRCCGVVPQEKNC